MFESTLHNQVRYLEDGDEAYPAMLAAIEAANTCVHMETYIYESDLVGWRFARALAAAARRGVVVRLAVDAIGSYRMSGDMRDYLRGAGVSLFIFNPLRFVGWELLTRRNHRKLLVIDHAVAFVGGLNVSLAHVPEPLGGGWHDALARIEGPAAIDADNVLVALFRRMLKRRERKVDDLRTRPRRNVGQDGDGRVWLLRNRFFDDRFVIRRRYLKAIQLAKHEIAMANAYFLPDRKILSALRKAARRGVRVRLLFPGVSDVPIVKAAMEAAYETYLRWGLEIREWPGSMLHHKLALFDHKVMCIGSYNLDNVSLRKNLEISAWMTRTDAVGRAQKAFERDWAASLAVQPGDVKLTWWKRFVAWMVMRLDARLK